MGEWRYSATILDLGTRWRWVISFTPLPLYPRGISPRTHCMGSWVGPRAGLDVVGEMLKCCHWLIYEWQCRTIKWASQCLHSVGGETVSRYPGSGLCLIWSRVIKCFCLQGGGTEDCHLVMTVFICLKSSIFRDITMPSRWKSTDVSE
jgi:hypothetical protein